MRFVMPASTLPGPHSTMCVTPESTMRRIVSTQRTGEGLTHQRVLDARRLAFDRDIDIVDHRNRRRGNAHLLEAALELVRRRGISVE